MQLRVDQLVPYGYADTAISTFHAFGDRLIREFAFELGLAPDVRVLTRAEVVVFLRERLFELGLEEYRPLGDPTRFLGALAPLFARCRDEDVSPDGVPRARRAAGGRGGGAPRPPRGRRRRTRRDAAAAAAEARRAGRAGRRLRPLPASCCRETAASTSATRSRWRCSSLRESAGGARVARRPLPVHPRRRVPGHEPRPVGARRAARGAPSQRDRRRRRRPVDLPLPRRRDQQHPGVPRPLPGRPDRRPAAELPLAGADPRRRPPAHPVQRPGPARGAGGHLQAAHAERGGPRGRADPASTPSRPAARRPTGSPGRSRRRVEAGARPRDHAVLVRANADADPVLRSLNVAGCRGGSPARRGCTPGPRCGCCSRSCAPSPTRRRAWTSTPWRRRSGTASAART